ncbi:transposase [Streptomyces sp. NPDC056708]|uniref:transposase n=1 Tax=unclassified Streptomyces TaxID=2593676 RepID=UPI00367C48E1
MITVHGARRSHGRTVGGVGTVVAEGGEAGRPPIRPRRQLIDGIRFRVRTGVPWRDVQVGYGPWGRVYDSGDGSGTARGTGSSPGSSPWPTRRVRSCGIQCRIKQ